MAYAKRRDSGRWTAVYQLPNGKERSAGTFDTEEEAARIAAAQEHYIRTGSTGIAPSRKATMTIEEYLPIWLKSHRAEPSTKTTYEQQFRRFILPRFGTIRVAELEREAVRAFFADLILDGYSPTTQRSVRAAFSAMMTTAVADGYRSEHPVRGLKVQPRGGTRKIKVLTTRQFQDIYKALPSEGARVLARVIISTGCRPSEAFVLLVDNIDFDQATITFERALQSSKAEYTPSGKTWHVANYTKTHDGRDLKVPKSLLVLLQKWIEDNGLGPGDLLFPRELTIPRKRKRAGERVELTEEFIATLGTKTAANGREYQHGTWPCYVTAKCRECQYCRQAFADYRLERQRLTGKTGHARTGTPSQREMKPFLDTQRWRDVFRAAVEAAGIPFMPTAYQLRHTHASWLIEAGEDPKTVMNRLGHTSLETTNIYVHQVDDGESAADIMESLDIDWDAA